MPAGMVPIEKDSRAPYVKNPATPPGFAGAFSAVYYFMRWSIHRSTGRSIRRPSPVQVAAESID
jgi:hypothetical protein